MSASEAYFLRAEAALMYKWNMGGTPKELYDAGVTVSMEERKATIGDYLKSEKVPAAYSDPSDSGKDIAAVSTITPKYNESASVTENLERILIQKWIANFPNGWETWADIRRTGYPKLFPIVNNLNTDGVTVQRGMRRLPFPQSEYNTNNANVKAAVSMLGGADNSATDLWWAKKN
ncbi:SusD/RagB family nutrient-binding outer membrane lipoprotein [Bacteroides faecis]|nr:SusD/RagB family nutrient-binding outer membrane lipoprotein [Bacteroides faecis]